MLHFIYSAFNQNNNYLAMIKKFTECTCGTLGWLGWFGDALGQFVWSSTEKWINSK